MNRPAAGSRRLWIFLLAVATSLAVVLGQGPKTIGAEECKAPVSVGRCLEFRAGVPGIAADSASAASPEVPPPPSVGGVPAVFAQGEEYSIYLRSLTELLNVGRPVTGGNVIVRGTISSKSGDGFFLSPATSTGGGAIFLEQAVSTNTLVSPSSPTSLPVGSAVLVAGSLRSGKIDDAWVVADLAVQQETAADVLNGATRSQVASPSIVGEVGLPGWNWQSARVSLPSELMRQVPTIAGVLQVLSSFGCSASFDGQLQAVLGAGASWSWPVQVSGAPSPLQSGPNRQVQWSVYAQPGGRFEFGVGATIGVVITMHTCRGDFPFSFSIGLSPMAAAATGAMPLVGQELSTASRSCWSADPLAAALGIPPGVNIPTVLGFSLCLNAELQGDPVAGFVRSAAGGPEVSISSGKVAYLAVNAAQPSAAFQVSGLSYSPHVVPDLSLRLVVADQEVGERYHAPVYAAGFNLPSSAPGFVVQIPVSGAGDGEPPPSNTLSAPTGLVAHSLSPSAIALNWSYSGSTPSGFRIYEGGMQVHQENLGSVRYTELFVATPGEHCYTLTAFNAQGESSHSNRACASVGSPPASPCTPSLITPGPGAELPNGNVQMTLEHEWVFAWGGCATADLYELTVRGPSAGVPLIATTTSVPEYHYFSTGYVIDSNRLGWTWSVRARVSGAWGPLSSSTFNVQPLGSGGGGNGNPPTAPSEAGIEAVSTSRIDVYWSGDATNQTGFRIVDGLTTVTVGPDATTYSYTGLAPGTYKCVSVVAFNSYGEAGIGAGCISTPDENTQPQPAPTNLIASTVGPSTIRLNWQYGTDPSGFRFYENGAQIHEEAGFTRTTDLSVFTPGTHCYTVKAFNAQGESAASNQACATIGSGGTPPAPTNLTAVPLSSTQIRVTWTDNSTSETGFGLEVTSQDNTSVYYQQLPAGTTEYLDSVTAGQTACYRVKALSGNGDSVYTPRICATAPTGGDPSTVPAPAWAYVCADNPYVGTLFWAPVQGIDGFRIYRNGTLLVTTGPSAPNTAFHTYDVTLGYSYEVAAFDGSQESPRVPAPFEGSCLG